jgi:hypothetical protein
MCANQADSFGRMKECPPGSACRNYRARPPTPTGEDVRLIPLTNGFCVYVDAADFEWLNQWRWRVYDGYAGRHEKGKLILMHRQIMQPPEGMVVDHINHNRFDNTRANLRNVTHGQNMHNMAKHVDAVSVYKGVVRGKGKSTWYARIGWNDTRLKVGPFVDEAEAGRAYDRMAVELFGENARLNFLEEWPPERRAQVYAEAQPKREALLAKAAKAKKRKGKGKQR